MTIWTPDLSAHDGPLYRAIADALARDVAMGRLAPGTRLPTHRELAFRLGVTVGTISRGYAEAERRGLIGGEVGRGTFVRAADDSAGRAAERLDGPGSARRSDENAFDQVVSQLGAEALTGDAPDAPVDLSVNHPSSRQVHPILAEALARLARDPGLARLMNYTPSLGLPAHREAGADWIARAGIRAAADQVAVTHGAQHGVAAALMSVARPGGTLLTEPLTYHGAKALASLMHMQVAGLEMDGDGLTPDSFERACRVVEDPVLYTVPTLHNPTTRVMPPQRRAEIARIAERYDVTIVEDDAFGFLSWEWPGGAPTPLAALAPERTVFVTGLSKCAAPSLRVGYLHAPAHFMDRIAAAVRTTTTIGPSMMAGIAAGWIADGSMEGMAAAQRAEARARQAIAEDVLRGLDFERRDTAFHVWLHLPAAWDPAEFIAMARTKGVILTSVDAFSIDRRRKPDAVRVCLQSARDREALRRGLVILRDLAGQAPDLMTAAV